MQGKPFQMYASALDAHLCCVKHDNNEWASKHLDTIRRLDDCMPHGSGLDNKTGLIIEESTPEKLVFGADYHHMNDGGMYDGWTEHRVIVTASLQFEISIKVTGRNRNDIKDYIAESFQYALTVETAIAD